MRSAYGLLVHSAGDLLGDHGPDVAKILRRMKTNGAAHHIGVSAYNADELYAALGVLTDADLVQMPVNVFDQRLVRGGVLAELKSRGVEIHARSAFLQGLLLMDPSEAPSYFDPVRDRLEGWRAFCSARGLSPLAAALGFVTGLPEVDYVVVGVESVEQLEQVLAAAEPLDPADFADLALTDPAFLEPSRWQVER
jgi:aryl-alcohol dehydrogenase-like predicted oxidoreductase